MHIKKCRKGQRGARRRGELDWPTGQRRDNGLGAPSFQTTDSVLDRVPPFAAPDAPRAPLSNS
eukprot:3438233-Pyramimonas_sp.AAC.1